MQEIFTLVSDFLVRTNYHLTCLLLLRVKLGQRLYPLKFSLGFSQPFLTLAIKPRVSHLYPVRERREILKSNVNAYRRATVWINFKFVLARENQVIVRPLLSDSDGLDLACDITMLLETDFTDILNVKFATSFKFATVTIGRPGKAIVTALTFVARETGGISSFNTLKESFVSLIQASKHILSGTKVNFSQVASGFL